MLGGAQLLMSTVLIGRMYQLQVIDAKKFQMLADENRINMRLLVPPRGRIFDRNGEPLAVNGMNYRVLITAEQAPDILQTLTALKRILDIKETDQERILREISRRRSFIPVTIRESIDWSTVSKIEVNAPDLPGISIEVDQTRQYLVGSKTSHILGYVAYPPPDLKQSDALLRVPGFRVGKTGIEKYHDLQLRGKAGNSQFEVNALGRVIRELKREPGVPGNDLILTVDLPLQSFLSQRLSNFKSAAGVLLDANNGAVLALASVPSFDPNEFNTPLPADSWLAISKSPYQPLMNKAISGVYAPGSTFKMVTALAALEYRLIAPNQQFFCPGHYTLGEGRFHCWSKNGHGRVNMKQALQQSCDVYFYELALRLGIERIAKVARKLGLGEATGIGLPGERLGLVPTPLWKKEKLGRSWQGGETLLAGIGQGFLLSTPLQLAVMTARIATGKRIKPYLLRASMLDGRIEMEQAEEASGIALSPRNLKIIKEAMRAAVNTPLGTGWGSRLTGSGHQMAGKTGTSQVRRISREERESGIKKNEDLPWKERDHSLFVAFAPTKKPRFAISVIIEHGGSGSKVAAPAARDILLEALRREPSSLLTAVEKN